MQDLEEQSFQKHKELTQAMLEVATHGAKIFLWSDLVKQIAIICDQLQAAEKDNQDLRMQAIIDFGQYQTAHDELKALREQKPVGEITLASNNGAGSFFNVDWFEHCNFKVGDKIYADPVAQSRDSAEPVGYINTQDIKGPLLTSGFCQLTKKKTEYSTVPTYLHPPKSNVATVEAKQAVPDGWRLVPIEMDDKMQAAAMKVLDDSIGNYASSRARDCYDAMLAAAPQVSAEQPDAESHDDLLERPARVGKTVFSAGNPTKMVIDAAYRSYEQPEGAAPEPLPYWPPCNPGCDPEFNGERSAGCFMLCKPARDSLLQQSPAPKAQGIPDALEYGDIGANAHENTLYEGYCAGWNDCRKAIAEGGK